MDKHQQDGDTFLGYTLARFEETLAKIVRKVERIESKIDAGGAGTTPEILIRLDALKAQGAEIIMSIQLAREALATLNTATNELGAAVGTVIAADQAEDDAFRAEIADLKAQIDAGKAITKADLEELATGMGGTKATLEAVKAALLAMGSNPTDPIPPVDIPPVEPPV